MPKFRKLPVVIEAVQLDKDCSLRGSPQWINKAIDAGTMYWSGDGYWTIKTLEGSIRAVAGDWIIRGVAGELYPCKPDIFEKTYERV